VPDAVLDERGAHFVDCKTAESRFNGTGHDEYSSPGDCVLTLP